jgi:glycerol 2-dehydrogenase (NADP+)
VGLKDIFPRRGSFLNMNRADCEIELLGKVKAIGLSNCSQKIIEKILPTAEIVPAVNQVCTNPHLTSTRLSDIVNSLQLEIHLYNPQHSLCSYLSSKKISVEAYSPFGSSNAPLLSDPTATEIAGKHGLQTSDVLLGYLRMCL